MQFNKPSTIGTCKQTKILLLVLEKYTKNLTVPLGCCCHSFMQSQVVDRVSYFFNVSKRVVFERASSGITTFNMIVELGSSNITTESVNYEVTKFILKVYFTVVRKWKELMRLERDKTMKLKRKQRKLNSANSSS